MTRDPDEDTWEGEGGYDDAVVGESKAGPTYNNPNSPDQTTETVAEDDESDSVE